MECILSHPRVQLDERSMLCYLHESGVTQFFFYRFALLTKAEGNPQKAFDKTQTLIQRFAATVTVNLYISLQRKLFVANF